MADARSLLRAQRAARRIDHPHAQYTEAGKLTCAVCHEPIKSDAQWEGHTRSVGHRQRLLAHQKARAARSNDQSEDTSGGSSSGGVDKAKSKSSTDTPSDEALLAQIISGSGAAGQRRKRKHEDDEDTEMADAAGSADEEDSARPKRSRQDTSAPTAPVAMSSLSTPAATGSPMKTDSPDPSKSSRTPPLVRRVSGTPSHGVEIQMPSRPATPSASATSATSTPKATPMGRSPLIPQDAQIIGGLPGTVKPKPRAAFATSTIPSTETAQPAAPAAAAAAANEDDDWAAFEAEVVHAAQVSTSTSAVAGAGFSNDAVISAGPLTAEELAAKTEEEEHQRRRVQADVELDDEREEATRALEAEFEEMEELEARVRKLKEKREAIRRGSVPGPATAAPEGPSATVPVVGPVVNGTVVEEQDGEDDEDDEEDEDDWAGFRFRA